MTSHPVTLPGIDAGPTLSETWTALVAACGIDETCITEGARKAYNRALKELRQVGATPDQIRARAQEHRRRWPSVTCTPSSLARHWPELSVSTSERAVSHDGKTWIPGMGWSTWDGT